MRPSGVDMASRHCECIRWRLHDWTLTSLKWSS